MLVPKAVSGPQPISRRILVPRLFPVVNGYAVGQAQQVPSEVLSQLTPEMIEKFKQIPNFPGGDYNAAADWITNEARRQGIWMWELPGLYFLRPPDIRNMLSYATSNPDAYMRALAKQSAMPFEGSTRKVSDELKQLMDVGWIGDTLQDVRDWMGAQISVELPEGGQEVFPSVRINPEGWIMLYRGAVAKKLGLPPVAVRWARITANPGKIAQSAFDEAYGAAEARTRAAQAALEANPMYHPVKAAESLFKAAQEAPEIAESAKRSIESAEKGIAETRAGIQEALTTATKATEKLQREASETAEQLRKQARETQAAVTNYINAGLGVTAGAIVGFMVPFFAGAGGLMSTLIAVGAAASGGYAAYTFLAPIPELEAPSRPFQQQALPKQQMQPKEPQIPQL